MIFRRIKAHIEKENWFAVFIDFCIVVIGVFIGIQVANWNDERADRVREGEYLARLSTDLELTIQSNQLQSGRNAEMIDDLEVALEILDHCELTPETEARFASALFFLGRYNLPEFVSGSFDELNNTGNFQLIRDLDLRRNITALDEYVDRTYLIDRQLNDRVTPQVNYVRRFVRFNPVENMSRSEGLIDPATMDIDFQLVCQDKEFKNSLSYVREVFLAVDGLTRFINEQAATLKTEIDSAL